MKKILTIATLTMAMTTVPLTAHAETVDEANQATQTAYQAYQQAEAEKNQAWNDSHDIYSDAWQTADVKSRALYSAYLDARQHAGLVFAEAKRNSSSQEQEPVSSSNSSASETQDVTGGLASKVSNDSNTKSDMPTNDNDTTKAIQTADSDTKSDMPTNDNDTTKAIQTADSDTKSVTPTNDNDTTKAIQTADSDTKSVTPATDHAKATQTAKLNHQSETVVRQPVVASKTSKTLPQTGNDKNKTMLTLIGSGAMGIATVAMLILIKERRHN